MSTLREAPGSRAGDDRSSVGERRRRSDGERSRRAILVAAARLATVEGIDGLSIGRLAQTIGMSKSGLYSHFGSKEELQLATIDFAEDVFDTDVVDPAKESGDGLARVEALCERFLSHVERGVFPGG
jgi:AcrR family transcriptional regulator